MATIDITVSQYFARRAAYASADTVTLKDLGARIALLTPAQIAGLASKNVDAIDASDNVLRLSVAQFLALGAVGLTAGDVVTLSDTGVSLAALTAVQIATLAGKKVDFINARSAATITLAQFQALGTVAFVAGNDVTLSLASAAFSALGTSDFTSMIEKSVATIHITDEPVTINYATYSALDTISFSAESTVVLSLTDDYFVEDAGVTMETLAALGIDTLAAADGTVSLTIAQYQALGSVQVRSADVLTIVGDDDANIIIGRDVTDIISGGAGNDTLSGGAGNDTIDGGDGTSDTADYADHDDGLVISLNGSGLATVSGTDDQIVNVENLTGGSGNDHLTGDSNANILRGGGGNDTLDGGAGSDTADYSDDTSGLTIGFFGTGLAFVHTPGGFYDEIYNFENLIGGSGNDFFDGNGSANMLAGGAGNDYLSSYGGDDTLIGGAGNDSLDGGGGTDTADFSDHSEGMNIALNGISPGSALGAVTGYSDSLINIENVIGGSGIDNIFGDSNANVLSGGAGNDLIFGYGGNDSLVGEAGDDVLYGLLGDDVLTGGAGADLFDGGDGIDTAVYSDRSLAVVAALNGANFVGITVGGTLEDSVANVENLTGGAGNDSLTGDSNANVLIGGSGNDTLDGAGGTLDTADYSSRTSAISVTLNGSTRAGVTVGGVAEDLLANIEILIGGSGNDTLVGDSNANTLLGGAGDDLLNGGAGNDSLDGGLGNATLDGGDGTDTLDYSGKTTGVLVINSTVYAGLDAGQTSLFQGEPITYVVNVESISGGTGNDYIYADDQANAIVTGSGSDTLGGGGGNDTLDGGSGTDNLGYFEKTSSVVVTLNGSTSASVTVGGGAEDSVVNVENLFGGSGDDIFTGDTNENFLSGGGGNDILRGGGGSDTLDGGDGTSDTADYSDITGDLVFVLAGADTGFLPFEDVAGSRDSLYNVENLRSGSGNDYLYGFTNNNILFGGAGNDGISGSSGNDTLQGGTGNDFLDGNEDVDTADYSDRTAGISVTLNGETLASVTVGGTSEDSLVNIENLTGGSGNDSLAGDSNANLLIGGSGNDFLDGRFGTDTADYADRTAALVVALNSSAAVTVTVGGSAEDIILNIENLTGGSGSDSLTGDGLGNVLSGGLGNDTLNGGIGIDTLNGGAGTDTADYSDKSTSVVVTLNTVSATTVTVGGTAEDTILNIENVTGGSAGDALTGDSRANLLSGGAGNDTLIGGVGNDTLDGGEGTLDIADYSGQTASVVATLNGATAARVTVGGTADDSLVNIENLTGGTGNDSLTGDAQSNELAGGSGGDTLRGGAGTDTLDGGAGNDTADYADRTVAVVLTLNGITAASASVGGAAEDSVINIENLTGGTGNDSLTGDAVANALSGGGGVDTLKGGLGNDTLDGGIGTDTADYSDKTASVVVILNGATAASVTIGGVVEDSLVNVENVTGSFGSDTLTGDTLANVLVDGAGNDLLKGGGGADTLNGGGGLDTADFSDKTAAVVLTLNGATTATASVGGTAEDRLVNIENLIGGSAADTLTGDTLANVLRGGAGNDTLNGAAGSDIASYEDKTAAVVVVLNGATAARATVGGVLEDSLANIENLTGGTGNDTLSGDTLVNGLSGGGGNDTLKGGGGSDTLDGGAGTDTADFSDKTVAVRVVLNGATAARATVATAAEDSLVNIENLIGGSGADSLTGDGLVNALSGGTGNDTLIGGAGADSLTGGTGADIFRFGATTDGGDTITDFTTGATGTGDKLAFVSANFGSLTAGALSSTAFLSNATGVATATTQRFLFNTTNGVLRYDADGSGTGAAVTLATLNVRTLASTDIIIV